MDVIGNNIANVNNQGFKASRTTFKEMYNQTMRGPSAPTENIGGTNAMQIGLGVSTGSIDMVFSTGSTQTTDRTLDLSIEGEGFFAVNQADQTYYTRSGNFYLDANGFMITSMGMYLQGISFNLEDQLSEFVPEEELTDLFPEVFENEIAEALWNNDNWVNKPDFDAEFADEGFNVESRVEWFADEGRVGPIRIPPTVTNISIGQNGVITAMTPGGNLIDIGMIPLVTFVNSAGLDRVADNLFLESRNAGVPVWHRPSDGTGAGNLKSGALEMSNVDLSREFTEMIITQRGFQANSRIITVSDTLLEELVNLKR
jgi:flagellar hook protein FlgE